MSPLKLLAFAPISNIWVHALPEAIMAEAVRQEGIDVMIVGCGGLIDSHCVAMEEAGLEPLASPGAAHRVCASCVRRAGIISGSFGLPTRMLIDYEESGDDEWVDAALATVSPEDWMDFEEDGIPLGRLAAYEFLLKFKISSPEIPAERWPIYLGQLRNCLRLHRAAPRLLDDVRPDVATAYNTLYSMNRVFKAHCEHRGIACYSLHGGTHPRYRLETQTMFRDDAAALEAPRSAAWNRAKSIPIDTRASALVLSAIDELFSARSAFVYSARHSRAATSETRASLGLRPDRRTLLVALSSRDEMFAADIVGRFSAPIDGTFIFPTQLDWLEFLIALARRREDLQFIVRVHPREFPNKRESVLSPNVARLGDVLHDLPENVVVDWPTESRGFYDVLQICDAVLSGWSSVGAESALFGVPVVTYDTGELLAYPTELAYVVRTPSQYEAAIDIALAQGVSIDRAVTAFRWFAFAYQQLAVDLSQSIPPRAAWSLRRVLQGLKTQKGVTVPMGLLHFLERREADGRVETFRDAPVVADTLREGRASLADSTRWPPRATSSAATEREEVRACLEQMVGMLGGPDGDPRSLATRVIDEVERERAAV